MHGAEEPYRVLVERMSDGALTADPDGIILYVNDRLCEQSVYCPLVGAWRTQGQGRSANRFGTKLIDRVTSHDRRNSSDANSATDAPNIT